ncbi:heavy metal-binding protein [Thermus scotoductus]|uniref:Heavy metal-binding protein n=3 Tax=Thermus TaxID=270 RepID=H7GHY1_9DEIN|nr:MULTISPECIES: cation transporter [Thermus]AMA75123.1 heavy metal-binding protein [Thermus parvatiensis]EIA38577.1 heavy metal binding protein [Thermus parvatiensis]RTG92783.1 heavy metal-binding protein [Thermus scotoductus]RTG93044.1 heavy metal-binding protein [Thermus scotoductus]RTG94505.1 heavy metal-binding protein [Thermus scotoductus]
MLKLKVEGMTCNHCVMSVKKALLKVPGVEKVEVSLERAEALVEGKADPEALIRAVEEEGYRAALAG